MHLLKMLNVHQTMNKFSFCINLIELGNIDNNNERAKKAEHQIPFHQINKKSLEKERERERKILYTK